MSLGNERQSANEIRLLSPVYGEKLERPDDNNQIADPDLLTVALASCRKTEYASVVESLRKRGQVPFTGTAQGSRLREVLRTKGS